MARAELRHGWVTVPYDGHDLARVHIGVGKEPTEWQAAFLDYEDGRRVAKVRPPDTGGRSVAVWLRIGDTITRAGSITT